MVPLKNYRERDTFIRDAFDALTMSMSLSLRSKMQGNQEYVKVIKV